MSDIICDARTHLFDLGGIELRRISPTQGRMFATAPDFEPRAVLYNDLAALHLTMPSAERLPVDYDVRMRDLCGEGWRTHV